MIIHAGDDLASRISPVPVLTSITPPAMSICHSCIGRGRSQRTYKDRRHPAYPGTVPAGAHDLTLGYFDTDAARSITQDGTTTTFTLDPSGRRATQASTPATGSAFTLVRHYTDGSDNPGWVDKTVGATTTTTRYTGSIGGDLGASTTGTGRPQLSIADLHGDVATTIDLPATGNATSISAWADYDEYGQPKGTPVSREPAGYGWLGAKERATSADTAGLTLMGDRLYNTARGLFTSTDPEPGGNDNAYSYPADPINMFDLDGHWSWRRAAKIAGFVALGACIAFSAGACAVAGAAAFGASLMSNRHDYRSGQISRKTFWRRTAVDAALSFVPGGRSVRLVGRHSVGSIGSGFRGTYRAMRSAATNRSGYRGLHRVGWSAGAAVRHSFNEFRGNWRVHPGRSARRMGYGFGAAYAGNRWG